VATQVAVSLVLLVGSVLFVRAHHQILNSDPGYDTRQVIFANIDMPSAKTQQARASFATTSLATRSLAGRAFHRTRQQPSTRGRGRTPDSAPGKSPFPVASIQVSANYFATMAFLSCVDAPGANDALCGTQGAFAQ